MTSIQVCERWPLPLLPGSGGHYRYLDTASKRNAQCFLELVDGLQIGSAVEYFGGVGIFSTIIQRLLEPQWHWVFELDSDCIAQLSTIPNLQVTQGDAHETMGTIQADLVVCDFPMATLRTIEEWPWHYVVARHPRYIVVSDTALRRLGLHRASYSKLAGETVVSFEDYVRVYGDFMWKNYGYSVTHVRHHVYSYFLLQPGKLDVAEIVKVTR